MKNLSEYLKKYNIGIILVRVYQKTISPDHGILKFFWGNSRCRFFPSCSDYALDAIRQYGLMRGCVVALYRVARCNPWNKGGYDPVR